MPSILRSCASSSRVAAAIGLAVVEPGARSRSSSGPGRRRRGRCSGRSGRRCCCASRRGCSRGPGGRACRRRHAAAAGPGESAWSTARRRVSAGRPGRCRSRPASPRPCRPPRTRSSRPGPAGRRTPRGERPPIRAMPAALLRAPGRRGSSRGQGPAVRHCSKTTRAMAALSGARGGAAAAGHLMEVETVMVRPLPAGCGVGERGRAGHEATARCRAPGSGPRPAGSSGAGGSAGGPAPAAVAGSGRPRKVAENATVPSRRSVTVVATRSGLRVNRSA